jgi:hypothetical protein
VNMKTAAKTIYLFVFFLFGVFLSGCYTQLVVDERSDNDDSYVESDTTNDGKNISINNHYYLDDNYRQSRFRMSFNYYYPSHGSWMADYYYSYFDDPYWGMNRPYYYNPWCYNPPPWAYNPFPYWYDDYYYYGYSHHYPGGYYPVASGMYVPGNDNERIRRGGSTRDPNAVRERNPISVASPTGISKTETSAPRLREPVANGNPNDEAQPLSGKRVREETPWWERSKREESIRQREANPNRSGDGNSDARPVEQDRRRRNEQPTYTPPAKTNGSGDTEARPVEQNRRRRNDQPTYTPPAKTNGSGGSEARPRERERRQSTYNAPQRRTQPSYSPTPRTENRSHGESNSGGSRSGGNSGGERRRAE